MINDYFLLCVLRIKLPMNVSIAIINLLGILKGGPIHKPYWLSWASLPDPFIFFKFSILCMAKMTINNNKQ